MKERNPNKITIIEFDFFSMTTDAERLKLYEYAKNIELTQNDCLLEFGVYFGGSLEALAEGLQKNKKYGKHKLIGIDNFETAINGEFAKILIDDAIRIGIDNKLKTKDSVISWFDYVNDNFRKYENVHILQNKASEYIHNFGSIALIHFDLPKFFREMQEILNKCIPYIKDDCIFIFQDFFYHWSAETIAFIYYLIKNSIIKFEYGVSSSLICRNNSLKIYHLEYFNKILQDPMLIVTLLDECHDFLRENNFCGARVIYAEEFYIAIIQYSTMHNFIEMKKKYESILNKIITKYGEKVFDEVKKYNYNLIDIYKKDLNI